MMSFKRMLSMALALSIAVSVAVPVSAAQEASLDYSDLSDFENALRGRVAQLDPPVIYYGSDETQRAVFDLREYDFIPTINRPSDYDPSTCPEDVDSSLWRQAQLNKIHGLFMVIPGVYQVRGYDLANMTIIESDTGVIVIDCTTTAESSRASLDLYEKYKGKKVTVKAAIITHSHVDHYGGIAGVLEYGTEETQVYAPEGFLEEAISENAFAGDAMTRRSGYQYGAYLAPGEQGVVDAGLGKTTARGGEITIVEPTVTVTDDKSSYVIDGVRFEFLLFPNTEAPAELTAYLPEKNLLAAAEIATHTLHNLLTPRGAPVRDARLWWKALDTLMSKYGSDLEVICASHHWPVWGNAEGLALLEQQRDMYKFLHDQTVRLINKGYTMLEIAAEFEKPGFLPEFMTSEWNTRGYYGTISHNVRAIYQKYIGWYDMNPSNLNPLPPEEVAAEYVAAMGGEEAAAEIMKKALAAKNYRWAAELGKHLVYNNESAANRELLAQAYDQLGYESEAGTWRNMYLVGAAELRKGGPLVMLPGSSANESILMAMSDDLLFDFAASRFMAEKAISSGFTFKIIQTDKNSAYRVAASNGVLNYHAVSKSPDGEMPFVELDRGTLVKLIMKTGGYTVQNAVDDGKAVVTGIGGEVNEVADIRYVSMLFNYLEDSSPNFNIVTP